MQRPTAVALALLCLLAAAPGCGAYRALPLVQPVPQHRAAAARSSHLALVASRPPPQQQQLARVFGLNRLIVDTVKSAIDVLYDGNDFARFFVLETVARVPCAGPGPPTPRRATPSARSTRRGGADSPLRTTAFSPSAPPRRAPRRYFAYLSVLHLRQTFGERPVGGSERMRTHYAEADNELHHLLIMESLGGNASVVDRTLAQTLAFFYYWYVVGVFLVSEPAAYHLSELIEDHAYVGRPLSWLGEVDLVARRGGPSGSARWT